MNMSLGEGDVEARRREEAARWIIALDRRVMSQEDRSEYENWRRDPANAQAMAEVKRTWLEANALRGYVGRTAEIVDSPALNRRVLLSGSAKFAVIAGAGALGFGLLYRSYGDKPGGAGEAIVEETAIGEQRSIPLSDGSVVNLNVASRLKYQMAPAVRKFELVSGQAEFMVAADANRPFIIRARRRGLRTLGGMFDLKVGQSVADVAVREGEVTFSNGEMEATTEWPGDGQVLRPGEVVSYVGLQMTAVRSVPIQTIGEWRDRIITFNNARLRDVVRELNLYFPGQISLQDAELGQQLVTLRLYVVDRDKTLDTISKLLSLRVDRRQGEAILMRIDQPI